MDSTKYKMASINDLKAAIRDGNSERVEELAEELYNNGEYIGDALDLAKKLNRIPKNRPKNGKPGKWDDIVDTLKKYVDDSDDE